MTMTDFSPAHVNGQKGDFTLIRPQFLGGVPLVLDRILKGKVLYIYVQIKNVFSKRSIENLNQERQFLRQFLPI